jgi:hypothetical protein
MEQIEEEACKRIMDAIGFEYFKMSSEHRSKFLKLVIEETTKKFGGA